MDSQTLVKTIIDSPKFKALSEGEQLAVLEQIILTGEILRDELYQLYNTSNLENVSVGPTLTNLPYEVFVNLIQAGQLEGKDLIQLCNSSAKLREYCDRSFVLNDGQQISQYVFRLALQAIKIDTDKIIAKYSVKGRVLTPKDIYIYYTIGDGVYYDDLAEKLRHVVDIAVERFGWRLEFPKTLGDLLYYQSDYGFEFLGRGGNKDDPDYTLFNHGHNAIYEISQEDYLDNVFDLDSMASISGKSMEELVEPIYEVFRVIADEEDRQGRQKPGKVRSIVTLEQLIQIIRNYPEYYRQYLLKNPYPEDQLKQYILMGYKNVTDVLKDYSRDDALDPLDLNLLELSQNDISYLIKLHHRIITGDLKINTPFLKDELL